MTIFQLRGFSVTSNYHKRLTQHWRIEHKRFFQRFIAYCQLYYANLQFYSQIDIKVTQNLMQISLLSPTNRKKQPQHSSTLKQRRWKAPLVKALSTEQSQLIDTDKPKMGISKLSHQNNFSSFSNQNKIHKILSSKAVYQAELSFKKQFNGELSNYLIDKFKHYLSRITTLELQNNFFDGDSGQNPESTLNQSAIKSNKKDAKECKGCSKLPKRHTITPQLRVTNAKQKIWRLVELKNQKEAQFSQFRECLKARSLKTEKQNRKLPIVNKQHIKQAQNQNWNKLWLKQYNSQQLRYRKRVMKKNQKYQTLRFNDILQ